MITQRDAVSQNVADTLTARAATFGIFLDDISITHLTFGNDFVRAVESKQVAQQEAEKARFYVEKVSNGGSSILSFSYLSFSKIAVFISTPTLPHPAPG